MLEEIRAGCDMMYLPEVVVEESRGSIVPLTSSPAALHIKSASV